MMTRLVPVGALALLAAGCSRPNPLYDDEPGRGSRGDGSGSGSSTGSNTQLTTVTVTADGSGTQGQSGTTTATSSQTTITAGGSTGADTGADTDTDTDAVFDTGSEETGDPPPGFHPCCYGDGGGVCSDPGVQQCACQADQDCCMGPWGTHCGTVAVEWCEVSCEYDCCVPHADGGCADPVIEAMVCNEPGFGYCCNNTWDANCVISAMVDHGQCLGPLGCCDVHEQNPGCNDPLVASCVCLFDPYCCVAGWDQQCINEAFKFCGAC